MWAPPTPPAQGWALPSKVPLSQRSGIRKGGKLFVGFSSAWRDIWPKNNRRALLLPLSKHFKPRDAMFLSARYSHPYRAGLSRRESNGDDFCTELNWIYFLLSSKYCLKVGLFFARIDFGLQLLVWGWQGWDEGSGAAQEAKMPSHLKLLVHICTCYPLFLHCTFPTPSPLSYF